MKPVAEVLLIEDEEIDCQIVQELLALKGRGRIHITEVPTFQAALERLNARAFDLVLLDTRLPEISALSALRTLGEEAPDTPILAHTNYITIPIRQAARARGAFDLAVRGDLNPMWIAVNNLLGLDAGLSRSAPAA